MLQRLIHWSLHNLFLVLLLTLLTIAGGIYAVDENAARCHS